MVGLGGLEPPTSPLSGAFVVLYMHSIMRLPAKQVRRLLFSARKPVKTAEDARGPMSFVFCLSRRWVIRIRQETEYSCCHVSGFRLGDLARRKRSFSFQR